jgi:hypothetical protein
VPTPLVVLLRNHQAGGTAAIDLARRAAKAQAARPYAEDLRRVAAEWREDLDFNESVMRRLDVHASRVQVAALRLGERVGRLKPNGHLVRRAPLSDVVELEALIAFVAIKVAGWRAGLVSGVLTAAETAELHRLLSRAETQAERLTAMHQQAATDVLGGPRP